MNLYLLRTYMDLQLLLFDIPNLCDSVIRLRKIRKTKNPKSKYKDQDYPAIVSRCCEKEFVYCVSKPFNSFYARTKSAKNPNAYRNMQLISAMNALGGIGKHPVAGGCNNKIGSCAEQHAAELLLRKNPSCKLDKIFFSNPIRPRTNEPRTFCDNCVKLFKL